MLSLVALAYNACATTSRHSPRPVALPCRPAGGMDAGHSWEVPVSPALSPREGGALSCAPSADAVAGNGRPLSWVSGGGGTGRPKPSADAVAGEYSTCWRHSSSNSLMG